MRTRLLGQDRLHCENCLAQLREGQPSEELLRVGVNAALGYKRILDELGAMYEYLDEAWMENSEVDNLITRTREASSIYELLMFQDHLMNDETRFEFGRTAAQGWADAMDELARLDGFISHMKSYLKEKGLWNDLLNIPEENNE